MVTKMETKPKFVKARVSNHIYERIHEIAKQSKDLNLTASEIVYVILKAFFTINKPPKDMEKVRHLAILNRKGILSKVLVED